MENTIVLTMKEQKRLEIIERVLRGEVDMGKAAMVLGLSERQVYRVKAKIRSEGVKGVIHGNRGRSPRRKLGEAIVRRVVALARGKYRGFNDHHFTEKLQDEGMKVSREKVRRILRAEGIFSPRRRRPPKHRRRRERRASEGLMLQVDGSPHDWLEGRGPRLTLLGAIDDATSHVPAALFALQESSWGYLRLFLTAFRNKGLPHSLYADRHSIFITEREPTMEEELRGEQPKTQVARALEELGITLISAYSPQAKGRIERLWGTFQDRLTSELRLAKAKTLTEAQQVLEGFLPIYNRRFGKVPQSPAAWRSVESKQLERTLCFKYRRTVSNDNTVPFHGLTLELPKLSTHRSWAHKRVDIHVLLDHSVEVFYQNERIAQFDSTTMLSKGLSRKNGRWTAQTLGPHPISP
jgi:transposase